MITATVKVDLGPLVRFKSTLEAELAGTSNRYIGVAYKQWGVRYRSFLRERYSRLSRGGGEWPHLALATLRARDRGKFKRKKVKAYLATRQTELSVLRSKFKGSKLAKQNAIRGFNKITHDDLSTLFGAKAAILIDTGTLFASFSPTFSGAPGQLEKKIPFGVEVGYGGRQLHPSGGKHALTVEQIAEFHQLGNPPKLPQRKLIVPPDDATLKGMTEDLERAINKMGRDSGNS